MKLVKSFRATCSPNSKLRHIHREFNSGIATMRQLNFAALDIGLHHGDCEKDPIETQFEYAHEFSPLPPHPDDRFVCSFLHIFAGGYSAGYYSYKYAEILSADAFGAFEEVGLDNDVRVQEIGRRFRDTVLSLGGSVHPSDVYKMFRGRDPDPEALLRHSGIDGVEWDAVELPSQFMENFLFCDTTMKNIARHYETGEVISSDMLSKFIIT